MGLINLGLGIRILIPGFTPFLLCDLELLTCPCLEPQLWNRYFHLRSFSPHHRELFVIASDRNPTQTGLSKKESNGSSSQERAGAWLSPEDQIMPKEISVSLSLGSISLQVGFILQTGSLQEKKTCVPGS